MRNSLFNPTQRTMLDAWDEVLMPPRRNREKGEDMRRAAKKDMNHNDIVEALKKCGCTVLDLSRVGGGCPDMLVGVRNENILLEIKRPKAKGQTAGKLEDSQVKFLAEWRGPAYVVTTEEEALRAVGVKCTQ